MQDLEQAIRAVATAFHAEAEACFHAVKKNTMAGAGDRLYYFTNGTNN